MDNEKPDNQTVRPPAGPEHGGILIVALFFSVFTIGVVVSGTMIMKSSRAKANISFMLTGQAASFAQSGLTEATNWYRRQRTQPVTVFAPQLDRLADPPVLDTDDADIGLVREFKIAGNVFGRYEVWKRWDADPDPNRLAWRKHLQALDVSKERGSGTAGTNWKLRSMGFVFVQRDPTRSFRERPNYIIATESIEAEISRMAFALPGQAAISTESLSAVSIGSNVRIDGSADGVGIYYKAGTGTLAALVNSTLDGVQATSPSTTYDDSIQFVFGVSEDRLKSMADLYITDPKDFPAAVPNGTMTVLESGSTLSFDKARPLRGFGIVVVRGDVVIQPGSASTFFGLLYVDGSLKVAAPATIQGALVVTGSFGADGAGDFVDIIYDDSVIQKLQMTMANYRVSRAPRRVVRDK